MNQKKLTRRQERALRQEYARKRALQGGTPPKPPRKKQKYLLAGGLCLLAAVLIGFVIWNRVWGNAENRRGDRASAGENVSGNVAKIALVAGPEGIEHVGYSRACWQGIRRWAWEREVPYAVYEPSEDGERVSEAERAIAEGANVLILPGWYSAQVIQALQKTYPEVYFVGMGISQENLNQSLETEATLQENAACFAFSEEQAGYLAGYAAVAEGYTRLGFLGGSPVGSVVRYGYGFLQGADDAAEEAARSIEIQYGYGTGEEAGALAGDWYEDGTELVFCCGEGVTGRVQQAAQPEGKVIGADVDWGEDGQAVLASAIKDVGRTTEMVLDSIERGSWTRYGGQARRMGLADGDCVGLVPEDSWPFSGFTKEEYEAVKDRIRSESVPVDSGTEAPPELSVYTVLYMQD